MAIEWADLRVYIVNSRNAADGSSLALPGCPNWSLLQWKFQALLLCQPSFTQWRHCGLYNSAVSGATGRRWRLSHISLLDYVLRTTEAASGSQFVMTTTIYLSRATWKRWLLLGLQLWRLIVEDQADSLIWCLVRAGGWWHSGGRTGAEARSRS